MDNTVKLILTHENGDFDAIASMLGAWKLYPDALPILPSRVNQAVQEFLALYQSALPFITTKEWKQRRQPVEQIILTDSQTYEPLRGLEAETPTVIIDHHDLERDLYPYETWLGADIGSASTIVVEKIREQQISLTTLEATLLALGIYADTGMLTFGGTTPRDVEAVAWLLQQGAVLDTIRRFLTLPMTDDQQILFDKLLQSATHRTVHGHSITIATTDYETYVEGIAFVTHRLIDIWDSSAIFVGVHMGKKIQLVCRSRVDDVNVDQVAELFGGGGHPRASAATIKETSLSEMSRQIWDYLQSNIRPSVRVADLMSNGLQYLYADDLLEDKLSFIRRVGHEGYPVVEDNRVIGLLTRRDADRASEHHLKSLKVRDVMIEGTVTLTPDDSVSVLEQRMVDSGWGQIPVINESGKPIGIVTRTDLIKHWAQTHPNTSLPYPRIEYQQIRDVLGEPVTDVISRVASFAQTQGLYIYMVGGVVRDILLERRNLDIDFVVEQNAIDFTKKLVAEFGGTMHSYTPFGTAKWILDEQVTQRLGYSADELPHHIDFATARYEYYEQPTALPTVYTSSIKLDLQRRDFTINTLAIQLSPEANMWHILDMYGGMDDLKNHLIRVLHSLSFVDDPTRILRAVRFSERLQFVIEPRTAELIHGALPMLKRITGERIQNEITLLLREDTPERAILKLQALGVLENVHKDFRVSIHLADYFEYARTQQLPWEAHPEDMTRIYWHIMMVGISNDSVIEICERLGLGRSLTQSMSATARLLGQKEFLRDAHSKPSRATRFLETLPEISLQVAWLVLHDEPALQTVIEEFSKSWRNTSSLADGNTLKSLGVPPGPQYKIILDALRDAWLDGAISNETQEKELLDRLIAQKDIGNDNL